MQPYSSNLQFCKLGVTLFEHGCTQCAWHQAATRGCTVAVAVKLDDLPAPGALLMGGKVPHTQYISKSDSRQQQTACACADTERAGGIDEWPGRRWGSCQGCAVAGKCQDMSIKRGDAHAPAPSHWPCSAGFGSNSTAGRPTNSPIAQQQHVAYMPSGLTRSPLPPPNTVFPPACRTCLTSSGTYA